MCKNFYYWVVGIPILMGMNACSSDEDVPTKDEEVVVVDLSATEMANCYIVQHPGIYKFKADNMFNQGPGLPVPPAISVDSASLIWQTVPSSISSVSLIRDEGVPYIQFEVAEASGNVLLAALDAEGAIEWSWHIWMPESEIQSVRTETGYEVMNINLGAMNNTPADAASYGLLYQWGRKDPFPAAATLTGDTQTVSAPMYDIENKEVKISNSSWSSNGDNTIEYSIANPTVCLSNYSQYSSSRDWLKESIDNLWGNPEAYSTNGTNKVVNKGKKTCYDPSPAGWRVAPPDVFANFTLNGGYAWTFEEFYVQDINEDGIIDINDYNYGWFFYVNADQPLYFPAAARFDGSYAMLMGSMSGLWGNYWSNATYRDTSNTQGMGFCALAFQVKGQNGENWITVSPSAGGSRADAYSIRCVRDN